MDKIFIRGLRVETVIGLYDWERNLKRPLIFDLELGVDTRAAAASDAMEDSVDYAVIRQTVVDLALALKPKLLETLAEAIARAMFERLPIHHLRLRIDKPGAIPDVQGVGVEIERDPSDYA